MEEKDLKLIEQYSPLDDELRLYVAEHKRFEEILEEFNRRAYLSPEDEMEQKKIKKLKLKGRDKIEQILSKYRNKESEK